MIRNGISAFLYLVLLFDLLILILASNNYFFIFLKPTGIIIPSVITMISLYLFARERKVNKYWIIGGIVISAMILGPLWLGDAITNSSYDKIAPQKRDITIIIEHRDATLGETSHFYNFYQVEKFPLVMKKLNKDTLRIVTRGTNTDNLGVLGVNNAKWINNKIIFTSSYKGEKIEVNTHD